MGEGVRYVVWDRHFSECPCLQGERGDHELQQLRVTRSWIHDINNRAASALHRFALVRRGGHEYKLFPSPTRSPPTPRLGAHFPLDVRPLAPARVRFCPPAFVGFGFRRLHPVLIHSASSFLTKSTTQRTASRALTTFFDYFLQISRHQLAKMRCGCRHITS